MSNEVVAVQRGTRGPWALAFVRLRRNRAAIASLTVFLLIFLSCLSAPLYARWAGVDPFTSTLDAVIMVDGVEVPGPCGSGRGPQRRTNLRIC